jgi:prefoldin subunit 5
MGNCESILNQIRYWEREATRLRNELKKWKKRKKDVESVKSSLSSVAQNSSSDVNSKITKANDSIDRSIDYPEKGGSMDAIFVGRMEAAAGGDVNLSQTNSSLQTEINICTQKITQYQNELNAAEREISRLRSLLRSLK